MKKANFIFALLIIAACSSDDDNGNGGSNTVDFIDPDGDGVSTQVEQNNGTDPNALCSFLLGSQDYSKTTTAWRNADCDGDGVPNGKELDPDGNEINDGNGTDPLDDCSFNILDQSMTPSNAWMDKDCDLDCKTNADELTDGTNPTDTNDFLGSGEYIAEVLSYGVDGTLYQRRFFDQNGSRIIEIQSANGTILYEYVYQNKLIKEIHTFNEDGYSVTDVVFEYTGSQITYLTVEYLGNLDEFTVEYDGTFVTVHNIHEPPGLFWRRIEFDGGMENIIRAESYRNSNSDYIYTLTDYTYDSDGNRTSLTSEEMGYNPDTGEYFPWGEYPIRGQTFEYSETVLNPMYEAFKSLEIPAFLSRYGMNSPLPSPTSPYLCTYNQLDLGYDQFDYYYEVDCVQSNRKPIEVTYINQYDNRLLRQFIYE